MEKEGKLISCLFRNTTKYVLGGVMAGFGLMMLSIFVGTFGLLCGLEMFGKFCGA